MNKVNKLPARLSIGLLAIFVFIYEYNVYQWAQDEQGAIIRVDVLLSYPVMTGICIWVFFLLKKLIK